MPDQPVTRDEVAAAAARLADPTAALADVLAQVREVAARDPDGFREHWRDVTGAAVPEPDPAADDAALESPPELPELESTGPAPFRTDARWATFLGTQSTRPDRLYAPRTLEHLREIVHEARLAGRRVRAFGTGHSFSDVAVTPDWLVDTSALNRVLPLVPLKPGENPDGYAHVEAGIKLWRLLDTLEAPGDLRQLRNLGGYTGQSIIGAVMTGTHGSGRKIGPLASLVASLVMVTEKGTFRFEPDNGPTDPARQPQAEPGVTLVKDTATFNAAVISMGAIGLVYSVLLRVEPRILLKEVRTVEPWSTVRAKLRDRSLFVDPATGQDFRHVEVWVNPHMTGGERTCLVTTRKEFHGVIKGGLAGRNPLEALVQACGVTSDVLVALMNAEPARVPGFIDYTFANMRAPERINWARAILSSNPPSVRGWACENMLPMKGEAFLDGVEATFALAAREAQQHKRYLSMLSLRFVKGSPCQLAPEYAADAGGEVCMVEVPTPFGMRGARELFERVSARMLEHGGRPHWGLEFGTVDGGLALLQKLYPRADEWIAIRKRYCPDGTFDNAWTQRVGISS